VLYGGHDTVRGATVPFLAFALFLGVAMSITAFPVLARILGERRMQATPTGVLALACAALDDVVAWSLLAVVVAITIGGTLTGAALKLALTAGFAVLLFLVVKPLLAGLVRRYRAAGQLTPDLLAVVLVGVLLSAYATELIGVHAIFGAFLFGAVMPRTDPRLSRDVLERLEQISMLMLLPVFFVVAGQQVDVRGLGLAGLGELVLILLAAIGGKFLGAFGAARLLRVRNRQAVALGILMNTRGLTEIVILQVGALLGVLDPELFTLMVIMALVTTIMTEPVLRAVYPDRVVQREIAAAERAELGVTDAFTVVVRLPEDGTEDEAERLVGLAAALLGREERARVVLVRLLLRPAFPLELASGLGPDLAAIAAAGDGLRRIARGLEASGVSCSVHARFSANPDDDLAELASTLPADVVLVPEPVGRSRAEAHGAATEAAGTALRAAVSTHADEAALVTVRLAGSAPAPGEPLRIAVLTDGSAGGRAAVRLAGRIAVRHGVAVGVGGTRRRRSERRAEAAIHTLRRHRIDAHPLPDHAAHVLVLPAEATAPDTGGATAVLRVRPAARDADEDLDQVVARALAD
jgi:Kef-type K+ transport system membrane component KefB